MDELARHAALSRSAFFDWFTRTVGVPPMAYLLSWQMVVAKELLRQGGLSMDEVAERVGYRSTSTFSTAFARQAGAPLGASRAAENTRSGIKAATPAGVLAASAG